MNLSYANTAYQSSGAVATFPRVNCIRISDPERPWLDSVKERLGQLVQLERGWDGYQGLPVNFANANFALQMLVAACDSNAPIPQIVPGSDGDLQIEWHAPGGNVELHVRGPYDVNAWRQTDETGPDGEEVDLTNDFILVARWIENLAELSGATRTAAA
jgi:hypothetical protein